MNKNQQQFDFFDAGKDSEAKPKKKKLRPEAPAGKKGKISESGEIKPAKVHQALLGWLLPQGPTGIGINVPTRISRFKADIAAFQSIRENRKLKPYKTMIIEIRNDREQCWPDCLEKDKLLKIFCNEKAKKEKLELEIQKNEPELKQSDVLFEEYQSWNYQASNNPEYKKCCRKIEKLEHALYKGSRFEQIRRAHVADFLYLAVPDGTVSAGELAEGWGLIYFNARQRVKVVKAAADRDCPMENRIHLIQNIAMANLSSTLFKAGVREAGDGSIIFSQPPRRRRGSSES